MSDARRWLDSRRPPPPAALAEHLAAALDTASSTGAVREADGASVARAAPARVAFTLAEAALERLRAVFTDEGEDSALDLLTADALLTYAGEAAAEAGPEALEALVHEFGPARLAGLVPDTSDAPDAPDAS